MKRLLPLLFILLIACNRPTPDVTIVGSESGRIPTITPNLVTFGEGITLPTATRPPAYIGTPTPNPTRPNSTNGQTNLIHTVTSGETLALIANQYGVTVTELMSANQLTSDLLIVGQTLDIPNQPVALSPNVKIIPDSELVYGPAAKGFDVRAFVTPYNGVLLRYSEQVEGQTLEGPDIVALVAHRFSVNPRLLLAILEHRAGWVTQSNIPLADFPLRHVQTGTSSLYRQLSWAADQLNAGFYGRAEGGRDTFTIGGVERLGYHPALNNGTAAVQSFLGAHATATQAQWLADVSEGGLFATYDRLFGSPFSFTVDPLWPSNLRQPPLMLPWAKGETWYLTGGPHGGWATGSAWAALDFVPASELLGCVQSNAWVRAMSDGLVVRSDFGAVVVDMDGDGYAGTGWTIVYMHIETRDRVPVGQFVRTGDPIGHPSCEGGFSNGTHVHVARMFNGRWVSADQETLPFVMAGWVSRGAGREYDGFLLRGEFVREACVCREELNAILHE